MIILLIVFKVDFLSNYATKKDLKNATGVDASILAAKPDLASLKAEIGKVYLDKLKTVPVDLSEPRTVVKNDFVKKSVYDKLVSKVNNIATSGFVLKTKHDTDKSDLEKKCDEDKKYLILVDLLKKKDYNAKICEIEGKMPGITGFATTSVLTAVENKMLDVSNFVKKTDYETKISNTENKNVPTADYNKFTKDVVANNIKSKKLVDKSAIAGFINRAHLDKKK